MTNEPDNQNGRNPDTTAPKPGGAPSTSGGSPKTPAKLTPMRDPVRREYGDRTDDDSKQRIPGDDDAMSKDADGDENSGEGHKGPRAEAKPAMTDKRETTDRTDAGQRNHPKPKPQHGDGKSNPQSAPQPKHDDRKSDRPQGGGSGR